MNNQDAEGLKTGSFDTWALIEKKKADNTTVRVKVDDKAAVRQKIIVEIKRQHFEFVTRSEWKAKPAIGEDGNDWNYRGIALHHAGNSFSCDANNEVQIHKAESIDMSNFGHVSYHYAISCDGKIYEALDIRHKGAHVADWNTGLIGIVLLADLTERGESYEQEYSSKSITKKIKGVLKWGPDQLAVTHDTPPEIQVKALMILVKVLAKHFQIDMLGGHREFQKIATGEGRACPGAYGMLLVNTLRNLYHFKEPYK